MVRRRLEYQIKDQIHEMWNMEGRKMLEVELYRTITCDNGKEYMICTGDEYYDYTLREGSWLKEANMVNKSYLEDAIKFHQTICVGRLENGDPETTYIYRVNPSEADKRKEQMELLQKMNTEQRELGESVKETLRVWSERKKYR